MDTSLFATHVIISRAHINPLVINPLGRFQPRRCVVRYRILERGKFDRYVGVQFQLPHTNLAGSRHLSRCLL